MSIDLWGIGLQAVNVLILMWLLSRVFWRPVSGAIAARQDTVRKTVEDAQATRAKADAALAEVTQARDRIAAERAATLDAARKEAATATKAALAEARTRAEALVAEGKQTLAKEAAAAEQANATRATDLALSIAAHLLTQMNGPEVQDAFLARLIAAIGDMPATDRATLTHEDGIEIVTATDLGQNRKRVGAAVSKALGGQPNLTFATDPALIAGLELRAAHFRLHNSWRADLERIAKAVNDAA